MAEKIQLEIVTPTGPVVSEMVDIVTAPGVDGDFGVLAGHAPLLSTIRIGSLVYRNDDQSHTVMVNGGFCEVSNNKITFLVESAERGEEIDVDRAMRARARAEKRLAEVQRQQDNVDTTRAETALHRALARLKAGGGK
jgi:F-type H+-transporting ATPase subunit epsilon